jgi:hypothetical protein
MKSKLATCAQSAGRLIFALHEMVNLEVTSYADGKHPGVASCSTDDHNRGYLLLAMIYCFLQWRTSGLHPFAETRN